MALVAGDRVVVVPAEGASEFTRRVYKGHVGTVERVLEHPTERGGHYAWVVFHSLVGHEGNVNTLDLRLEVPGAVEMVLA